MTLDRERAQALVKVTVPIAVRTELGAALLGRESTAKSLNSDSGNLAGSVPG
jgi:hypothetical protein